LDSLLTLHRKPTSLAFDVHFKTTRVTDLTSVVTATISVRNADLAPVGKNELQRVAVNVLGKVRSVTGRVVLMFEDTARTETPESSSLKSDTTTYVATLPLRDGIYRVEVAIEDPMEQHTGVWIGEVTVGN
jgi:hypothetical protein